MHWSLSPIAFTVSLGAAQWPVHWYGLFFAATFVYGVAIFRYFFRLEGRPPDDVYDLALAVIAGTLVGARLGHVLVYEPRFYLSHPWKVLAVWEGGLASHGAVIGILLAVWAYSRSKQNQGFLWLCDRIGLAVPLSGCLIRIGNFFNSEILGKPADVPWAVVFSRVDDVARHPVQLYEAGAYFVIFLIQFAYYRRCRADVPEGMLFGRFFILVFGARFILEFFKDPLTRFDGEWSLSIGQWLSLPAVLFGAVLVKRAAARSAPRRSQWRARDAEPI